jgi:hypothetical protein
MARALGVAVLSVLALLPALTLRITAPANHGAHGLTSGFGRGRLDLQGIVTEGRGTIHLPRERHTLTARLTGVGPVRVSAEGANRSFVASLSPVAVRLDLPGGGDVRVEAESRIRLHEIVIERSQRSAKEIGAIVAAGLTASALASRGAVPLAGGLVLLAATFFWVAAGSLSGLFARIALVQLAPLALIATLFAPIVLALRTARFPALREVSRLALVAFGLSLMLSALQLALFEPPLPMGDPGAYLEMGGKYADALARVGSPLNLGPILSDLQPYLALPATGLLYGLFILIGGVAWIYLFQAIAMAVTAATVVSICETHFGPRAARFALVLVLIHPSFTILSSIVQPEPFILAAWSLAALLALHSLGSPLDRRGLLGAGLLFGAGLSLHPQGLSFLLLAFALCLAPWSGAIARRPFLLIAPLLGVFAVLLPVAAAEHFSRPLAHVLDKQYGFFAYTSPHPLGFWLYTDSGGWQGPLRIEDTTYQKELIAMKGEGAVASSFFDVAAFVARHPLDSLGVVLTNLHRLWQQPDNPFATPFVLPYELQVPLHRALVVLFLLALPAWLGGRLGLLALPFVMLSMTYPAYHVFNKYATPALPFTIIGAAFALDLIVRERARLRGLIAGLALAAAGALLPASFFAGLGLSGGLFIPMVWGALWVGLAVALAGAVHTWGVDGRSRWLGVVIGMTLLLASSFAASRNDTTRGVWSASLETPLEISCRIPSLVPVTDVPEPAWLFVDVQSADAVPPRIEVNGQALEPPVPTMPVFGLATSRGHRDPATFRQVWRARVSEDLLASANLEVRVSGGTSTRLFGDIRAGNDGPRLSLGQWPYLSVYRLMHEGEYRLPTRNVAPPQACATEGLSGRPGVSLVRIPAGEESQMARKSARPVDWIF